MIFRSPGLPVAIMLLVRMSTENRTGTSAVSPSATASCGTVETPPSGNNDRSTSTSSLASPFVT